MSEESTEFDAIAGQDEGLTHAVLRQLLAESYAMQPQTAGEPGWEIFVNQLKDVRDILTVMLDMMDNGSLSNYLYEADVKINDIEIEDMLEGLRDFIEGRAKYDRRDPLILPRIYHVSRAYIKIAQVYPDLMFPSDSPPHFEN